MVAIREGAKAPDFSLKGSDGKTHTLSEFRGKNVVLYFYPKDDTPGCTIEAKGFNKAVETLDKIDTVIVGISKDNLDSHKKFCNKYSLKFLLLSDPDSKVIALYDAYGDKGIFGMGTLRKTYIIDKTGNISKIFGKVRPLGHMKEVVSAIASM
jgi:peroxiredoxin Q/BCP